MFSQRHIIRLFHSTPAVWSTNKSLLAKLRKKTGYTFSNCKKALEMHSNDLEKAEKWLHDQAQAMGWSKASKLGGRKTSEGLVAVMVNRNHAAMVELNCETDFVSRNKQFKSLVDLVAKTCLNVVPEMCKPSGMVGKEMLDAERLAALPGPDGKTLADHVALTIGLVGENMMLRRAALINVNNGLHISGYSHPAAASKLEPMLGKYAALIAFRQKDNKALDEQTLELSRQMCQHIVGMNPARIGDPNVDKPQANSDDESVMIYQEFLLDPSCTVEQVLREAEIEVVDFVRFECGAEADSAGEEPPVEAEAARAKA